MRLWSRRTLEERMLEEIEGEFERYRERCGELHESFERRLRLRDEARGALLESTKEIDTLQGEAISLLGSVNAATLAEDERRLKELEDSYRENAKELGRARRRRNDAAGRLAGVDITDEEAARELMRAALELLEDYATRVDERKERIAGLLVELDERRSELERAAAPLLEEYESRRAGEEPRRT
jgi:hypothetical protein